MSSLRTRSSGSSVRKRKIRFFVRVQSSTFAVSPRSTFSPCPVVMTLCGVDARVLSHFRFCEYVFCSPGTSKPNPHGQSFDASWSSASASCAPAAARVLDLFRAQPRRNHRGGVHGGVLPARFQSVCTDRPGNHQRALMSGGVRSSTVVLGITAPSI